jgi:hypothetical protein
MLNENLIATLEQSLRQTRNTRSRMVSRLHEIEAEAESLRQEIDALDNIAQQTETAIYSLLASARTANKGGSRENPDSYRPAFDDSRTISENPPPAGYNRDERPFSGATSNVRSFSRFGDQEPRGLRFADRTITQACTLLLKEANRPIHVNELHELLVQGGFEFKGNNPTISIAVSLNRNRRFRKVAPGTFDLVMREASQAV